MSPDEPVCVKNSSANPAQAALGQTQPAALTGRGRGASDKQKRGQRTGGAEQPGLAFPERVKAPVPRATCHWASRGQSVALGVMKC